MRPIDDAPAISVIVPCLGHAVELRRCLAALAQQEMADAYEIIVVDSAADKAIASIAALFGQVRLVRSTAGLMPGDARNLGVTHARARRLAFTDADCVPEPDWLVGGLGALRKGAVMAGGPVLDLDPTQPVAATDNLLQFVDFPVCRPESRAVYFPTCNLAIERTCFEKEGGFPTNLQLGEDVLLTSAVARRHPDRTRFIPGMVVRHQGRRSLAALRQHHWTFGFCRGRLGLLLKPEYQQWGRFRVLVPGVAAKRLSYLIWSTLRWNPQGLGRLVILLPLVLAGLWAWAQGFQQGCREAWEKGQWLPRSDLP